MKKLSLQWRLTIITTLFIALICGCLTMFIYGNGVYYINLLQNAVISQAGGTAEEIGIQVGDTQKDDTQIGGSDGQDKGLQQEAQTDENEIYIGIPKDAWDDFAEDFSILVYNNKTDYRRQSLIITALMALLGGVITYFISGRALKPLRDFSDKIEKVQAQNLSDSRIDENDVKELNQLSISYNKMLKRLSDAFEVQRQFTANAAHELRTPLAVMQVQLDSYNAAEHSDNDKSAAETIKMITEQNERLSKMVKTLLDMSELQTIARNDEIAVDALIEEVIADLEPLAEEKHVGLIQKSEAVTMMGSDILIYRLVYNLVENAIKYNKQGGYVTVSCNEQDKHIHIIVADTGSGIPEEMRERVFEPFFRVDKSRSRELGGVGLGLALVNEIVRVHDGRISVMDNSSGETTFEVEF